MLKKRLTAAILSASLCLTQAVSGLGMNVLAASQKETIEKYNDAAVTLTASAYSKTSTELGAGDTLEMRVGLKDDPGLAAIEFTIDYDTDTFEYQSAAMVNNLDEDGNNHYGDNTILARPQYSDQIVPNQTKFGFGGSDSVAKRGDFIKLTFKVKDTAINGDYNITIASTGDKSAYKWTAPANIETSNGTFEYYKVNVVNNAVFHITKCADKKPCTTAPEEITVTDVTSDGFKVVMPDTQEYTYSTFETIDPETAKWYKADTAASGLEPNTLYYVFSRVAETETEMASTEMTSTTVTTKKLDLTKVIEVSIGTDGAVGTVLEPKISYKTPYSSSTKIGEITYKWSNGSADKTYTVTAADVGKDISVTVTAENCDNSVTSNIVTAGKKDPSGTVEKPVVTAAKDGFTIKNIDGYEYYYSSENTISADAEWTAFNGKDAVITGKEPGSVWYVFVRMAATEDTNASGPSDVVEVRVPNNESKIISLTVSNGDAVFEDGNYTVNYLFGEEMPTIVDVEVSEGATYKISDGSTADTKIITVTAENGVDSTNYTIMFVQQKRTDPPVLPKNTPETAYGRSDTIEITAEAGAEIYYTTDGTTPTENSTKYDGGINIADLQLDADAESFTLNAVAINKTENKALSETATATIYVKSAAAYLEGITVNDNAVNGFEKTKGEYTFEVTYAEWKAAPSFVIKGIKGKGTFTDPDTVTINVEDPNTGATAYASIVVTSDDGEDSMTYTVAIKVLPCPHTNTAETNVVPAGCVNPGHKDIVCTDCETIVKENEEIPALGHEWGEITKTEPTCTTDGAEERSCTRENCDAENAPARQFVVIDKLGHAWGEWTTEDGENYTRECSVCKITETATVTAAADAEEHTHTFGEFVVTKEADCENEGSETAACTFEGCGATLTQSIPTTAHTPTADPDNKDATCTTAGFSAATCSVCGKPLSYMDIPAKGHTWSAWTANGNTHSRTCTVCGESETAPHTGDPCSVCGYSTGTDTPSVTPSAPTTSYVPPVVGSIPQANAISTDSFSVRVNNKITGKNVKVHVSKNNNKFIVTVGSENNKYFANIYNFDDEFIAAVEIQHGKAKFTNDELDNKFYIVIDETAHGEDVSAGAAAFEKIENIVENTSPFAAAAALAVAFIAIAADVIMIKKRVFKK